MKEQRPELVKQARVPDVALGSHTASLGLAFDEGPMFPERFRSSHQATRPWYCARSRAMSSEACDFVETKWTLDSSLLSARPVSQ